MEEDGGTVRVSRATVMIVTGDGRRRVRDSGEKRLQILMSLRNEQLGRGRVLVNVSDGNGEEGDGMGWDGIGKLVGWVAPRGRRVRKYTTRSCHEPIDPNRQAHLPRERPEDGPHEHLPETDRVPSLLHQYVARLNLFRWVVAYSTQARTETHFMLRSTKYLRVTTRYRVTCEQDRHCCTR